MNWSRWRRWKIEDAYKNILEHFKKLRHLEETFELLCWDQETMMPSKGSLARSYQLAAMEEVMHEKKLDERIPEWLEKAYSTGSSSPLKIANLREIKKIYFKTSQIPKELSIELVKSTALSQNLWVQARSSNTTEAFIKALKRVIKLKQSEADCLKQSNQSRYEALLQEFEPNQKNDTLKKILGSLKKPLKQLSEKISTKRNINDIKEIAGKFDRASQIKISKQLAEKLCYDFNAGRLDESLHPFSSGHRTDARITTRIDVNNPLSCISSVMHEVGHALYEQGIPESLYGQPVGTWCSMGFHESQSRLIENQLGRSESFCSYLFPILAKEFPNLDIKDERQLYLAINKVTPNFIRVDSDEINYNLHILLRYELEEELISGILPVEDLEHEWNRRFFRDFEVKVKSPNQGFLQDIHWASGLFGYFPTYLLGNLYAADIFKKMKGDITGLDSEISNGNFSHLVGWLRKNIHQEGRLLSPSKLIKKITREQVKSDNFLQYLTYKFEKIYNI